MTHAALVRVAFFVSLSLTALHLAEENRGKLWRYFGAIAGVRISDGAGVLFFTIILGLMLGLAAVGILGMDGSFEHWIGWVGVGLLIGGRVSDWWNSHLGPVRKGYIGNRGFHGNPGLLSSWLYLADAALLLGLLWVFRDAWAGETAPSLALAGGALVGIVIFIVVIPAIRAAGKLFPAARTSPWRPGQPMPDWAAT